MPKNENKGSSPSGFTKFFSAIFMCGVDPKDDKGKKSGVGCCAGPQEESGDEKENKFDIQPSQSLADSALTEAMERRKKKKKLRDKDDSDDDSSESSSDSRSSSSSDGFKKKKRMKQKGKKKRAGLSSSSSDDSESDPELKQFAFLKK